jgi:hypothetical protein
MGKMEICPLKVLCFGEILLLTRKEGSIRRDQESVGLRGSKAKKRLSEARF